MNLLNTKRSASVRSFTNADSCALNAVLFLKQDQVATANNRGQVKLWDLRSTDEVPSKICHLSMDLVGISSIAKHPTQPHIMVAGGTNGVLAFWDLR
jgi:nuclear pore complex protein Nup43